MKFFVYRSCSLYQFSELWWTILIGIVSRQPWQANGTSLEAWIDLQVYFQLWSFLTNFKFCFPDFWAAAWFFSLGFDSLYKYECIRSRKTNQIICIHGFWYLIFKDLFQSFFHVLLLSIIFNQSNSFHIWSCTNYWIYFMHKKILFHWFYIFHVFYLIKWIINNKKFK